MSVLAAPVASRAPAELPKLTLDPGVAPWGVPLSDLLPVLRLVGTTPLLLRGATRPTGVFAGLSGWLLLCPMLFLASTKSARALVAHLLMSTWRGWVGVGVGLGVGAAGVGALPPARRAAGGTERDLEPMGRSCWDMVMELEEEREEGGRVSESECVIA